MAEPDSIYGAPDKPLRVRPVKSSVVAKTVQLKTLSLILGAGVLLGVGIAVGGAGATLVLKAGGKAVNAATKEPAKKPTMTREECEQAFLGKTEEQVLKALGKPFYTSGSSGEGDWSYSSLCYDAITGKPDKTTFIMFRNGIVVRVF